MEQARPTQLSLSSGPQLSPHGTYGRTAYCALRPETQGGRPENRDSEIRQHLGRPVAVAESHMTCGERAAVTGQGPSLSSSPQSSGRSSSRGMHPTSFRRSAPGEHMSVLQACAKFERATTISNVIPFVSNNGDASECLIRSRRIWRKEMFRISATRWMLPGGHTDCRTEGREARRMARSSNSRREPTSIRGWNPADSIIVRHISAARSHSFVPAVSRSETPTRRANASPGQLPNAWNKSMG